MINNTIEDDTVVLDGEDPIQNYKNNFDAS